MSLFDIEKEILEITQNKEDVEAVVIGKGSYWGGPEKKEFGKKAGKVLTWDSFLMFLKTTGFQKVDNGYGEICLPPIVVWTSEKVIYLTEYDGAVNFHWVPRNPSSSIHETW